MTPNTKIDLNHNRPMRIEGLDELAPIFFPGNKKQQRLFLAIFVELKRAPAQFLSALEPIAQKYGFTSRSMETVRAKMRRLGLIDHVSRFNQRTGYREGWVFSRRFERCLSRLTELVEHFRDTSKAEQEAKDRDLHRYL
jgi:hypothetical protein